MLISISKISTKCEYSALMIPFGVGISKTLKTNKILIHFKDPTKGSISLPSNFKIVKK